MSEIEILEAVRYRSILVDAIDNIIEHAFQPAPKKRINRGVVQSFIFQQLQIPRSNLLCTIVNERMELKGYKPTIMQGRLYYKSIEQKT